MKIKIRGTRGCTVFGAKAITRRTLRFAAVSAIIFSGFVVPATAADVFVIEHTPNGDGFRAWSGVTLAEVQAEMKTLTANPYDVVTEAAYDAAVAAYAAKNAKTP